MVKGGEGVIDISQYCSHKWMNMGWEFLDFITCVVEWHLLQLLDGVGECTPWGYKSGWGAIFYTIFGSDVLCSIRLSPCQPDHTFELSTTIKSDYHAKFYALHHHYERCVIQAPRSCVTNIITWQEKHLCAFGSEHVLNIKHIRTKWN